MATSSPPVDQFEVKGKVALVTGAASGIGLAVTKSLLKKGAKVCMADINEATGQNSLASLREEFPSGDVSFIKVDVTVTKELAKVFVKTKETYGSLDIVCNNAGIVGGEDNWRRMFEVNVFAMIEGISLAIEHMSTAKGGKGGVVVNTASILGLFPVPGVSMYFAKYSATKHAIIGYTRIYEEVAKTDGIRVNCVCPGPVDTPLLRSIVEIQPPVLDQEKTEFMLSHFLSPEKVAEGVLELITDTSKAGAAMAITYNKGLTYPELLDNEKFES